MKSILYTVIKSYLLFLTSILCFLNCISDVIRRGGASNMPLW